MKINFVRTLLGVTVTRFSTTNFFINPFHFLNLLVQYYKTVFFYRSVSADDSRKEGQWYLAVADTADDSR